MFRTHISRFVRDRRYRRIASILGLIVFAALWSQVAAVRATQDGSLHRHASHSKLLEHQAVIRLVEQSDSTHVAVQSGLWTAPETWRYRNPPGVGARIWIPAGIRVTLASSLLGTTFEWIRVDGSLLFRHDRNTGLKVVTLIVSETGSFEIGSPNACVRPDKTATVVFADRGPRDRRRDPLDLGGGLIALGRVNIHGAPVVGHVSGASDLVRGRTTIDVDEIPKGWMQGDLVVVPGTNGSVDEDELIRVASLDSPRRLITLAEPLRYTHLAPKGAQIRIGNLTRNVVFLSANEARLTSRGHVMIMHVQTGVTIDGAGFYGLGRTDTRIAHTIPVLDAQGALVEGTDANTIGRYPVHFHIRSGARSNREPNVFRNSVIVDSPKHGLVNHGGNVIAEGNVTFRVDGTHFFAENGREIGAFRGNLAIRSSGSELSHSDDAPMTRMYMYDFGHNGYGYWLQGGGVRVIGNYAFGHRAAAYSINGHMMREGRELIYFSPENLDDPSIGKDDRPLRPGVLPFRFSGNQGAVSFNGLQIWYSGIHAKHAVPSLVEDSFFWAIERHGVDLPYTRNVVFRNVTVLGSGKDPTSFGFGNANEWADSFVFERVRAEGFAMGVDMPTKGFNRISNSYLDNRQNIRIRSAPGVDLDVEIEDVRFGHSEGVDIDMQGFPSLTRAVIDNVGGSDTMPRNADLSPFFGRVRVIVKGRNTGQDVEQVYFADQAGSAVPFAEAGIPEFVGKTSRQIWDEFGLAIGGTIAPPGAVTKPRIVGLVGPTSAYPPRMRLVSDRFTKDLASYVPRVQDDEGRVRRGERTDLHAGWNVLKWDQTAAAVLVFGDASPPAFEMDPGFRSEIHPADLQFGITLRGWIVDQVGAVKARTLFAKDFKPLVSGPDGAARLEFSVEDGVGNRTVVPIVLRVTDKAVRRGSNSLYYSQGPYSPAAIPERGSRGSISANVRKSSK